jgi:branched-chain amino acid transport system substrate-binding protein
MFSFIKRYVICLIICCLVFSLVACSGTSATTKGVAGTTQTTKASVGKVFKVGMFNPLSGDNTEVGTGVLKGAQLAIKQINAGGGLLGSQVELVYYDDSGKTDQSVNVVERLIEQDKVNAIIGSTLSGSDLAVGHLIEAAKIPLLGPGTATSWLEQGWTYMFRSTLSVKYNIAGIISACSQLNIKKIALFNGKNEYGENGSENMKAACKTAGIEIVGKETYAQGDTDFTAQFTTLAALKADAYYLTCDTADLGNVVKQARANGFKGYILGDQLLGSKGPKKIAGAAMENVIFTAPYVLVADSTEAASENQKVFFEDYKKEYGKLPEVEQCLRGYDSMMLIAEGVKRAKSFDGTAVRNAILTITDYVGLGGFGNTSGAFNFTITKNGDGLQQGAPYWVDKEGKDIPLKQVIGQLKK